MRKIERIIKILNRKYKIKPWRGKPFRVLIGTILSHRTKDEISWPASDRLFEAANTLEKMSKLSEKEIVKLIKPVGFYNQKAKRIKQICRILKEKYKGRVPRTREELMKLPGVGGKTADILLSHCFGQPVIACDAHVIWIANQLGWTNSKNPEKVREDLHKIIPLKYRKNVNLILVQFGKEICITGRPKCFICPIEKYCPSSRLKIK